MTYTETAFVELSNAVQMTALGSAVEICCHRLPMSKLIWAFRCMELNLTAELKKFRDHRAAGSLDMPTAKQPRTHGVPFHYFGAPELARLINYVSEHHAWLIQTHFDGSPLNFPLGLAKMLYSTHLECEGAIWIENWQDVELKERKAAFDRQNPNAGIAVGEEATKEAARAWNAAHPDTPVPE